MSETGVEKALTTEKLLKDKDFTAPVVLFSQAICEGRNTRELAETLLKGVNKFNQYTDDTVPGHEEDRYLTNNLFINFQGMSCPIRIKNNNGTLQCTVVLSGIKNIFGSRAGMEALTNVLNEGVISLNDLYGVLLNIEDILVDENKTENFRTKIKTPFTLNVGTDESGAHEFSLGVTSTIRLDAVKKPGHYALEAVELIDVTCDVSVEGKIDTLNGTRGDGWNIIYKMFITKRDVSDFIINSALSPDALVSIAKETNGLLNDIPEGDDCKALVVGKINEQAIIISKNINKKEIDENAVKQLNFERAGRIAESMNSYISAWPIINLMRYKGHSGVQLAEFLKHIHDEHDVTGYISVNGIIIKNKHMAVSICGHDDVFDTVSIAIGI